MAHSFRMTRRQRRRVAISSAIVLGVAALLSALFVGGAFNELQRRITDTVFFLPKRQTPEPARFVVLVAMDDKSVVELRRYGRLFNWPRSLYADVVRRLTEARARTIMFDVLFDAEGEGDAELVDALNAARERAVNVVMPTAGDFLSKRPSVTGWETYGELFEPLPAIKDASAGLGMANQLPDPDGTLRRMPLVFDVGGQPYPSVVLTTASKFLRRPEPWDGPIENGFIPLAGRMIPVDRTGSLIVNYLGGPYESAPPAFPVVSFVDVLNGRVPPETFERKIAVIGVTATAFADDYWTPPSLDGKMDGVETHAHALETILRGEFLWDAPSWVTIALIVGFALVAGATLATLPPLVSAVISALALGSFVVAASTYFDNGGVMLNLIYPPLSLFLTYAGIMLYRVIFEQGQARALKGVLGQYLSPSVVAEVTRDPDSLKLGGDEREMTVLFSDIRGFTSYAESVSPETLVNTLTEYLTAMSDVIFRHNGTIDKYMGDAIMAFWNAPQRQPDHAALACRAACGMIEALERLNREWAGAGRPPLRMGLGINTGPMKVGNMGSASRFDYTVMGDAVNLGSRLEGLNKEYGTTLIVSEATLRAAGDGFHSRFLDLVAVKGKSEPVAVYEMMTLDCALGEHTNEALRAYNAGVEAYRERDWLRAAARFQEALRWAPGDGPSRLYLERCQHLIEEPPPADWDGVFVMTHK